jgi:hypothetical protein
VDFEDEDEELLSLPSIKEAEALSLLLVKEAQGIYNKWDENDRDTYAGGGICHYIADAFSSVFDKAGITAFTQSSNFEQHVTTIIQVQEGIYDVDLHYSYYETGGGFTWKKIEGVQFTPDMVSFYCIDSDPKSIKDYLEESHKGVTPMPFDPSMQQSYPDMPKEEEESNQYLEVLYKDYKTKINSATIYLQKLKEQEDSMDKIVHGWVDDLHKKYEILDRFQKTRPRTSIPGDFALEDRSELQPASDGDLKAIDSRITDKSEQINFSFKKLENFLKFLSQTYLDSQETINAIYDRYMEIYENM